VVAKHQVSWAKLATDSSIVFWLPTQRQLQEMIQEAGYWWMMGVGASVYDYIVEVRNWKGEMPLIAKGSGPDPETCLLRALLEVMEKEER